MPWIQLTDFQDEPNHYTFELFKTKEMIKSKFEMLMKFNIIFKNKGQ